jgi:hypothetical protein
MLLENEAGKKHKPGEITTKMLATLNLQTSNQRAD